MSGSDVELSADERAALEGLAETDLRTADLAAWLVEELPVE